MSEEDPRQSLDDLVDAFDLGSYEVAAYLAVLEAGELTAGDIADHADIPQPRVYDTVRSLADRGLVELHESRPMRVVAVDPAEAFAVYRSALSDAVSSLESLYTRPERGQEAVSLVRSSRSIRRYMGDVIERAEFELTASLTPELLDHFADDLAAARERDVSVEIIVTPASDAPSPEEFDYARVASTVRGRRGITSPVIVVADGERSIYATQDAVRDGEDRYAVIFNNSALGFLVLGFFGTILWTTADEVFLESDAPPALPHRYGSIRRCIKDVQKLEGDVYARIEGRDIETGEPREVSGRVSRAEVTPEEEIASLVVETADGEVSIGGLVAAYEDVEAREITISREEPPADRGA
jgi:sugar-specific transcriptional regulator TrmB